jgi:hypothetical protein
MRNPCAGRVIVTNDKKSTHNPTNAEIDAAETGNPDAVETK